MEFIPSHISPMRYESEVPGSFDHWTNRLIQDSGSGKGDKSVTDLKLVRGKTS